MSGYARSTRTALLRPGPVRGTSRYDQRSIIRLHRFGVALALNAASLREGMAETLTVLRLGVPPTLARTLRSTNVIESMISICRTHARNVKRWRDGR
jgi:hypothetical protein